MPKTSEEDLDDLELDLLALDTFLLAIYFTPPFINIIYYAHKNGIYVKYQIQLYALNTFQT